MSENIFAEVYCPKFHLPKMFVLNVVLGFKFKGNGQVSMGNLRETEISISPLENYGRCIRFPKISPTRNVVNCHHFLQWIFSSQISGFGFVSNYFVHDCGGAMLFKDFLPMLTN